ncbi:MAG TPA: hypothetical protein VF658_08410 [Pyrinomonadaceae bacterium]
MRKALTKRPVQAQNTRAGSIADKSGGHMLAQSLRREARMP